jgi:hypothetical protein
MYVLLIFIVVTFISICIHVYTRYRTKQEHFSPKAYEESSYENNIVNSVIDKLTNNKFIDTIVSKININKKAESEDQTSSMKICVVTMNTAIDTFNKENYINVLSNIMKIIPTRINVLSIRSGSTIVTTSIIEGTHHNETSNFIALQSLIKAYKTDDPLLDELKIDFIEEVLEKDLQISDNNELIVKKTLQCPILNWSYITGEKPKIVISNDTLYIYAKKGFYLKSNKDIALLPLRETTTTEPTLVESTTTTTESTLSEPTTTTAESILSEPTTTTAESTLSEPTTTTAEKTMTVAEPFINFTNNINSLENSFEAYFTQSYNRTYNEHTNHYSEMKTFDSMNSSPTQECSTLTNSAYANKARTKYMTIVNEQHLGYNFFKSFTDSTKHIFNRLTGSIVEHAIVEHLGGTAVSTLDTLVAGETPASVAIALIPTTAVQNAGTITCTYDQDVFVKPDPVTCAATPASDNIACAATSARVVEFTAGSGTFPAQDISFAMTSNLASNYATGDVGVSCVSSADATATATAATNATSFTTATVLTIGTSTLDTLVAGETPTSNILTLGITTALAETHTITCTYDKAVFANDGATVAMTMTPVSNDTTATSTSDRILSIIIGSGGLTTGDAVFTMTGNLAANPAAGAVKVTCVSTTDTAPLVVNNSYTTTAPTMLTLGTSVLSTLVAGATPTANALTLGITTGLVIGDYITCTYDKAIFAPGFVTTVGSSSTSSISIPTISGLADSSGKVLTLTVNGGPISPGEVTFTMTSNLAANPAPGNVLVTCSSTKDTGSFVNYATFTTTAVDTAAKATAAAAMAAAAAAGNSATTTTPPITTGAVTTTPTGTVIISPTSTGVDQTTTSPITTVMDGLSKIKNFLSGTTTTAPVETSSVATNITELLFKCNNDKWMLINDPSKSFIDVQPIMVKL